MQAPVAPIVHEFLSEHPGQMATVASAQMHARRARVICLRDAMASWLKASRAARKVWERIQSDPMLEPLLGPEIDVVHSRVNRELNFLAIRIVAEANAVECAQMGAPEPPLPVWQILGWAMEQVGSEDPSQAARWVCLQGFFQRTRSEFYH